jgi:predicted DNA-binding transcriptional regulator YafY
MKCGMVEATEGRGIPGGVGQLNASLGEAGVGYALEREHDLPPLTFDPDELEALALGARIASSFGDDALGRAADSALSKIESVLPPHLRARLAASPAAPSGTPCAISVPTPSACWTVEGTRPSGASW